MNHLTITPSKPVHLQFNTSINSQHHQFKAAANNTTQLIKPWQLLQATSQAQINQSSATTSHGSPMSPPLLEPVLIALSAAKFQPSPDRRRSPQHPTLLHLSWFPVNPAAGAANPKASHRRLSPTVPLCLAKERDEQR
jgi:hypothetical protein